MQEISGSLVGPKMSLVLCNFNGFAETIKNQWKSYMFWPAGFPMAFAIWPENHGIQKMLLVLVNFNGFAKTTQNQWKYVTFRMGKHIRIENVEIPLFFKAKAMYRHT